MTCPTISSARSYPIGVSFTVDRLDELIARLRRAKVTIIEGPYAIGGARAVMIEDPDGLAIELIERGPQLRPRGSSLPSDR